LRTHSQHSTTFHNNSFVVQKNVIADVWV
jgi:hypothetical protein